VGVAKERTIRKVLASHVGVVRIVRAVEVGTGTVQCIKVKVGKARTGWISWHLLAMTEQVA
jgi:phage baseplate assembly protein gpV